VTRQPGVVGDNVPVGTPIGRCWLRLFGVLPFDYDHLRLAELDPGRGFDEQSTMMSMRRWRHQRTVTPGDDSKAIVRDRITFELRTPLRSATPIVAAGLRALFGHRHRRLQRHFASRWQ
jgi:ligand-binding SRPBCC domain-containing protein